MVMVRGCAYGGRCDFCIECLRYCLLVEYMTPEHSKPCKGDLARNFAIKFKQPEQQQAAQYYGTGAG